VVLYNTTLKLLGVCYLQKKLSTGLLEFNL